MISKRKVPNGRKKGTKAAVGKPFWRMNAKELNAATAEFDQEFVGEGFKEPTAKQKAKLEQAKRKPGRPKVGGGVQVISVSLERGLLKAVDSLAKEKKAKRAEIISFGLQAILNGEITVPTK